MTDSIVTIKHFDNDNGTDHYAVTTQFYWAAPLSSSPSKFLRIKDEETFSKVVKVGWLERSANLQGLMTEEHLDTFAQ